MKIKNTKKVNKKFRVGLFLKILASVLLLTSMLITSLFGTVNAEYVKSFSKKLSLETTPSTPYIAYLKDSSASATNGKWLYYNHVNNITQRINLAGTVKSDAAMYQIKLPVTDAGLYNISFTVCITGATTDYKGFVEPTCWNEIDEGNTNKTTDLEATKVSLNTAVGCKVDTSLTIDKDKPFESLPIERTQLSTVKSTQVGYTTNPVYGPNVNNDKGYHDYQWKTLAPARSENVTLTFNLESGKAAFWTWDLRGLTTATTYTLNLTNISIEKIAEPEGPYLNFSDSHYVNNALTPTRWTDNAHDDKYNTNLFYPMDWPRVKNANGTVGDKAGESGSHQIRGRVEAGKTRTSIGRGTYLTEADYDGMTMQAETLVYGYMRYDTTGGGADSFDELVDPTFVEENGWYDHERYSNLVSFGIPIENVERGKTYKVTYDLGFARQGSMDVENGASSRDYANYAEYADILAKKKDIGSLHFESYLYAGTAHANLNGGKGGEDEGLSQAFCIPMVTHDTFGRGNVPDSNKAFYGSTKGTYVTRYNELWNIGTGTVGNCYMSYVDSINHHENISEYAILNQSDAKYNWYNALRHVEYNGQNKINWITFTNSTFTFTVDSTLTDEQIKQLHWTWAIDGLEKKSWYRIKFDNVRIEEVVSYGSNVENNGLTFNGVNAGFATYEDIGLFRGANGTGQNGQPRVHTTLPVANMNLYAPIFDAASSVTTATDGNQRIGLRGYAVCKGGVEKYVWSADGGVTWYDMETQYLSDITDEDETLLNTAESHAENSTKGLKTANGANGVQNAYVSPTDSKTYTCEHVDFTVDAGDGKNAQYDIVANLKGTPYERAFDLDIIFAAVPSSNTNLRCEIMRITNYNELANYRTSTLEIESDIEVTIGTGATSKTSKLNATYNKSATVSGNPPENVVPFSVFRGYNFKGGRTQSEGYSKRVDSFSKYEELPTTFANIPVKNKLTIRGYALVYYGVENYYWSVDYGKTWNLCGGNTGSTGSSGDTFTDQREYWYDGVNGNPGGDFAAKAHFSSSAQGLTADLSDYVGQSVDIIFAGKSKYNGTYCPVGRIDNVAVYGDPDEEVVGKRGAGPGPFFVHYDTEEGYGVSVGGTPLAYADKAKITELRLNYGQYWNLEQSVTSLSSYEPYHVDVLNTRVYNTEPATAKRGDVVTVYGWMVCHGGVAEYKYTFDGGKNWTDINTNSGAVSDSAAMLRTADLVDATFEQDDTTGGGFRSVIGNDGTSRITIPTDAKIAPTGRCNLIVVAVSPRGYTYPVANIALIIEE